MIIGILQKKKKKSGLFRVPKKVLGTPGHLFSKWEVQGKAGRMESLTDLLLKQYYQFVVQMLFLCHLIP